MKKTLKTFLALCLTAGWMVSPMFANEQTAYQEILAHYESIRLALLNETFERVAEHAAEMASIADATGADFSPDRAGVPAEATDESMELLAEIAAAAADLGATGDLENARSMFYEVSKPLGRYRKLAGIEETEVVYCPMAEMAWIQPRGEVGNPYLGPRMPSCGTVIAD